MKCDEAKIHFTTAKGSAAQYGQLASRLLVISITGADQQETCIYLRPHVIIQRPVRVVGQNFLSGAVAVPHGLQTTVPVQQLEDGHKLLKLQHGAPPVGLQHELEGADARRGVLRLLSRAL